MSDQFPPAPPPPPPPQQPYQQPQYGYGQPRVKTGMSAGVKALLIIVGIFTGLGVLAIAGFLVVGAIVVNEAEEIVNTPSSDLEENSSPTFGLEEEEEEEEDSTFDSSFDDEEDLATWCGTVDTFDSFTRASTDGFTPDEVTEKILTVDEMITIVRDTAPSEFEVEVDEILVPFEETVALFESVDFDATQITADDQAALNESFEAALPSVVSVRQACLDEGVSVFESD